MQSTEQQSSPLASSARGYQIADITQGERALHVHWNDGTEATYHYIWLRDNCPNAFHPQTGERSFNLLSVSVDIHPIGVSFDGSQLTIDWSEGNYRSVFEQDWLRDHSYCNELAKNRHSGYVSWDNSFVHRIPEGNQPQIMADDGALLEWMRDLDRYGLALIRQMPDSESAVIDTASRIDYLRQTNFGVTFDVVSVAKPINLAYTAIALPLHTDLANQEVPPGYQFLHCLANSSTGGESTFVDGLRVLEQMREENPDAFRLLSTHAIPFRFHDEEHDIRQHHPVINLDSFGNIIELKYNAHLADIFDLPEAVMYDYYVAYRDLMARLQDPAFKIELRLEAGDMVVFDNRRVLHGRNAFDETSGSRHLRGCYVDRSEFKSKLRVLEKKFTLPA